MTACMGKGLEDEGRVVERIEEQKCGKWGKDRRGEGGGSYFWHGSSITFPNLAILKICQ